VPQVLPQAFAGDRGTRLVHDQHRADVGVHQKTGQHGEQEAEVVGHTVLAALGVRDRHHAVPGEPPRQLGHERRAPGGRRDQRDVVPGAGDTVLPGETPERAGPVDHADLVAEHQRRLVEPVGIQRVVPRGRLVRQTGNTACPQCFQAARRADAVTGP
jgi:hypothetical protein